MSFDDSTTPFDSPAPRPEIELVLRSNGKPVRVIIVEVMLTIDRERAIHWSSFVVAASSRYECPVVLVVVTNSAEVEAWAKEPFSPGHAGRSFAPVVVGPSSIERVDDVAAAEAKPADAILSAIVHATKSDVATTFPATIAALDALPAEFVERRPKILEVLLQSLAPDPRTTFEELTRGRWA